MYNVMTWIRRVAVTRLEVTAEIATTITAPATIITAPAAVITAVTYVPSKKLGTLIEE